MNKVYEKLLKCVDSVREMTDFVPEIGIVLGSGFGKYADEFKVVKRIDYHDIEGFPVSTVAGHAGEFIFGYMEDVPIVLMNGRVHYYEGYDMTDVVLPIRLMKMLGAKVLFLTNASGGINSDFSAGDLMLITGQISCFVPSPLIGPNIEELGVRFPDMSHVYDEDLQDIIRKSAKEVNVDLKEGVYIQLKGPNYETPEEIRMCKVLGADAVGMSTACEAQAANHMGMKICGVSCISNLAAGIAKHPLTHAEIQETADRVAPQIKSLIRQSVLNIHASL
ncbi:purine-nucleoside phosphorylase [Eubacterium oxidoreducens]|uniref:Purine nucleoside phosphorylase n=1 Tax=Eubacterium oxidoreducens TaxID=1732 RepID=A0A1G6BES8_EUBOX|nr:purine-nucleoside phosphorylase [Eubacterium oxidoreducens]SDB19167.1 purine-nucleoside phosphorylase [Eubacterium oxidoreducens]